MINILKAFALRNSISIPYHQGFIFLVTRLLYVLKEEEKTFWCFTKIIEDYLPIDYYVNYGKGLGIDFSVIDDISDEAMNHRFNLTHLCFQIDDIRAECFSSLYTQNINLETSKNILDLFFICGDVTLFRAFYFYATKLFDKSLKENDNAQKFLVDQFKDIKPNDRLIYYLLADPSIDDSLIKEKRKAQREKEKEKEVDFDKSNIKEKCDPNTPYCFYNEKIKRYDLYSEYKIFKVKKNTDKNEDYFTNLFKEDKFGNNNDKFIKNENPGGNFDDILVERVEHVCTEENQVVQK